jgi:cytochrome c6
MRVRVRSGRERACVSTVAGTLLLLLPVLGAQQMAAAADGDVGPISVTDGQRLFQDGAAPPCALCHAMNHAGASGAIGPSLDELKPDAQRVGRAIRDGIGVMPAYATLSDQQIESIARYVEQFSGGE